MSEKPMTKGERDNLAKLNRQRGRHAKQLVDEQVRVMRAEVEDLLSAEQHRDDELWRQAVAAAEEATAQANRRIAEACTAIGLPKEAWPGLAVNFYGRSSTALASRRSELRKLAHARIDADATSAKTTIEGKVLEVETALVAPTLTSEDARAFLDSMPDAKSLMPQFDLESLAAGERQPWAPPKGLAASMLTPSTAGQRHRAEKAIAGLTQDRPEVGG